MPGVSSFLMFCAGQRIETYRRRLGEREIFLLWKAKEHWIDLPGERGGKQPCIAEDCGHSLCHRCTCWHEDIFLLFCHLRENRKILSGWFWQTQYWWLLCFSITFIKRLHLWPLKSAREGTSAQLQPLPWGVSALEAGIGHSGGWLPCFCSLWPLIGHECHKVLLTPLSPLHPFQLGPLSLRCCRLFNRAQGMPWRTRHMAPVWCLLPTAVRAYLFSPNLECIWFLFPQSALWSSFLRSMCITQPNLLIWIMLC